jgi:hypothetical protein
MNFILTCNKFPLFRTYFIETFHSLWLYLKPKRKRAHSERCKEANHSGVTWNKRLNVRFQVLTVSSMNMTAFWDMAPCSLVEVARRFRGAFIALMIETVRTFETLKHRSISARLHGAMSQKAVIFKLIFNKTHNKSKINITMVNGNEKCTVN